MTTFSPDVSSSTGRLLARIGLVLLALICLGGGTIASYYMGIEPLYEAWRSRNWQPVNVRIEDVQLGDGPGGGNRGAKVLVSYRYRFADLSYEGHRFGLHDWIDNAEAQKVAYADLLYTRNTRAWINPENPGEALLNRELHWSAMLMAIPALGIAAMGALILWAAIIGTLATWRASRRLRKAGVR